MPVPRSSAGRVRRAPAAQPSPEEDLVRLYLREIGRHPLLVQEQEVKLAKAIEGGEKAARRLERARTLEEVGHEFRLTRERIRQIEAKALAKLRHPAGGDLRAFTDGGVAARH